MGCISSKVISRSLSIQQERERKLANPGANPGLEELAISEKMNEQVLALICRSASKLHSSNKCPKPDVEEHNLFVLHNNASESMSSLQQPYQRPIVAKRSRSYHSFPDLSPLESSDGFKEEKWDYKKGIGRAWSFHTVEEYDAMIEKIGAQQVGSDGEDDGSITNGKLHPSGVEERQQSSLKDETSPQENSMIEESSILSISESEPIQHIANPHGTSTTKEFDVFWDSSPERSVPEGGFKRKSISKGLESLEIPQGIQFQAVASLREWLNAGGQVYSPGAYVTPKFGSYSLPISGSANECNDRDSVIFNPELVDAFEECMHQLEAGAESILKQIAENMEEESAAEKQAQDEILLHRND